MCNPLTASQLGGRTLASIFREAGCLEPASPSCAACLGGPADTYARMNEPFQCVSTTNRNFPGRMGHKVRACEPCLEGWKCSLRTFVFSLARGCFMLSPRQNVFPFLKSKHHDAHFTSQGFAPEMKIREIDVWFRIFHLSICLWYR